jgi:hypothetical protein
MADNDRKEHYKALQRIKTLTSQINEMQEQSAALTEKEIKLLKKKTAEHKKLSKQVLANNKERIQSALDYRGSEEESIKSLGSMYSNLGKSQRETMSKTASKFKNTSSGWLKKTSEIGKVNRSIAKLDKSDTEQLSQLHNKRNDLMVGTQFLGKDIQKDLKAQNEEADKFASMSENGKKVLESQHAVLDGIKTGIQTAIETAFQLYGNVVGAIGGIVSGLGMAVEKVGKLNKEFGTSMFQIGGIAQETALLEIFFEGSAEAAKTLSSELGGTEGSSLALKTNIGIMSETLGLSGAEAATLVGQFSRLNNGSTSVATDMIKTSNEFARQNNIIPSELMADLAASAEEFALFGEEGGDNILRAAGYAQKLGVNMKTLSGVAENLLDFESSITKELELGALLGRNINLNKARELAYSNDIEGATKETLRQLGGINAFNKMDYYQKKATADLLGVSVAELSKMASNQEKAANLSKIMGVEFGIAGEGMNYLINNSGSFITKLGGGITALGQMNLGLQAMGTSLLGMVKTTALVLKNLLGMVAGPVIKGVKAIGSSIGNNSTVQSVSKGAGKFKDKLFAGIGDKAAPTKNLPDTNKPGNVTNSLGKINMTAVLKGAAAMLIMAGAVFVLGKALQEYKDVGLTEIMTAIGSIAALGVAMGLFGLLMAGPLGVGILLGAGAMLIMASALFVLGHALQAISKGFGALGMIQPMIGGLLGMIGGIFQLSAAFTALAGSLSLLGMAGIAALPVLLGLAVAGAGLGFLINAVGGGESETSLPALPEETKQYYKDSLEVLSDIRKGINQGSIIKMNRDVVGGTVSQSQSESGVNRGQFNR